MFTLFNSDFLKRVRRTKAFYAEWHKERQKEGKTKITLPPDEPDEILLFLLYDVLSYNNTVPFSTSPLLERTKNAGLRELMYICSCLHLQKYGLPPDEYTETNTEFSHKIQLPHLKVHKETKTILLNALKGSWLETHPKVRDKNNILTLLAWLPEMAYPPQDIREEESDLLLIATLLAEASPKKREFHGSTDAKNEWPKLVQLGCLSSS